MRRQTSFSFFLIASALFLGLAIAMPLSASAQAAQADQETVPYDKELLRLAEVMGALHSLRPLCGYQDVPDWRQRMISLLDVETQQGNRRRLFIEHFNRGYRGFSSTYRVCTPAARLAMKQYVSEGQALISSVTDRYSR